MVRCHFIGGPIDSEVWDRDKPYLIYYSPIPEPVVPEHYYPWDKRPKWTALQHKVAVYELMQHTPNDWYYFYLRDEVR